MEMSLYDVINIDQSPVFIFILIIFGLKIIGIECSRKLSGIRYVIEFESQSNKQKIRERSMWLYGIFRGGKKVWLSHGLPACPHGTTEAELTTQEGHGPEGLLHKDLGDRGQVMVRVVGHHNA